MNIRCRVIVKSVHIPHQTERKHTISTITAEQLFTVDGFTQACLDAFDSELENQLGIDVEDYRDV